MMNDTNYENAPQTKMLATNCCVCSRPLCDSISVEFGIGPVCRSKYGFDIEVDEESRKRANKLVWEIAVAGADKRPAIEKVNELVSLGFSQLAAKLTETMATVVIEETDSGYIVRTPYSEAAVAGFRRIMGRRWLADEKANFVPKGSKGSLWRMLKNAFPGHTGRGPSGLFII